MLAAGRGADVDEVVEPADLAELDDTVRCGACDHAVTRAAYAFEVAGTHVRTFRNPAGWSFRVACYRDAPGCVARGPLTDEATWFPGYEWCLAHCGGCGRHLGWWFVGAAGSFAGIVTTRVH